jgi:glucans biosynthesis protein C
MTTMTTAAAGERLHALDGLRAVAMLLGIVLHAGMSFTTIDVPWPAHDVRAGHGFDALVGLIHGFRMQVFFFLAGFFGHLLWKRLGTRGFLAQRGKRIGIPFVAGLVVIVPVILVIWTWADAQLGTTFIRDHKGERSLLTLPTGHLWFLEMLLILYAIAMALALLRHRAWMQAQLPRIDAAFDALVRMPFKPLLLALPTVALLWTGLGIPPEIEISGQRLLPAPAAVAYYALFFGMGWWRHRRMHLLGECCAAG